MSNTRFYLYRRSRKKSKPIYYARLKKPEAASPWQSPRGRLSVRAPLPGRPSASTKSNSSFLKIVKITEELERKSWDIFDRYKDKDFSFVDCASLAVMKELGIRKAFAFDTHFRQFGFEMTP